MGDKLKFSSRTRTSHRHHKHCLIEDKNITGTFWGPCFAPDCCTSNAHEPRKKMEPGKKNDGTKEEDPTPTRDEGHVGDEDRGRRHLDGARVCSTAWCRTAPPTKEALRGRRQRRRRQMEAVASLGFASSVYSGDARVR